MCKHARKPKKKKKKKKKRQSGIRHHGCEGPEVEW